MEYRTLGSTGTKVSELCFGTWRFAMESDGTVETDCDTAHDLLDTAWENGINFIDTANVYGDPNGTSEDWIGDWLSDYDREDFVIASKVYFPFDGWGEPGPNDSRPLAQTHPDADRGDARPPRDRLPRHLLHPPLGRGDADRGDALHVDGTRR